MGSQLCCRDRQKEQSLEPSRRVLARKRDNQKERTSAKTHSSVELAVQDAQITTNNQKQPVQQVVQKTDIYVGENLNGIPHGTGTKNYVNGDYYKGEWVNGKKQGKGEQYYFQLNTTYKGEWKNDMKNGIGHQTQANGSWYQGQFNDELRHGKGIYFDKYRNVKYAQVYSKGNLQQRKQLGNDKQKVQDQFPTLKLDKERFNSGDLVCFEQKNPEIKQLDLQFLLKYYGLKRIVNLDFIEVPVSQWTIKQVHLFLGQINLSDYKVVFYENKIKGKDLSQLTDKQMKEDLNMKLGDRKILRNYLQYLHGVNKSRNKQSGKSSNMKKINKRKQSISIKNKQQQLLNKITRSIEHKIIEEDEEWNDAGSQEHKESKQSKQLPDKHHGQYETQNLDIYASGSRDNNNFNNFHSQAKVTNGEEDQASEKTEKGSQEDHEKQMELSPGKRKKSQDVKQYIGGMNSQGGNNNNNQNNLPPKRQKSSQSSDNSQQEDDEALKIKRKKTSNASGSQQIRQLYQFLKQNQSLDFIIKQKDIEITQQIGKGGYGKVSKGKYMHYPVAVKDYMKAGRSQKSRQQFMKQVHILSDLKHPNIVLYMGLCITVNRYQLVTQYMENGSLYDQLHIKKTKFTKQQQLQIIDDIVQGMVYLHSMKKMLHRDLKSSNVLIAEDYKVKLCDFGLSGHKSKKQKKNRIGTYPWMAPEVVRDEELDYFSDVYSFGVILWQILTEKVPYSGMSTAQIIGDVGYDKNHKLEDPPEGSDEFIISIMNKCLQRDPDQRPTFMELQQFIKEQRKNRPAFRDVWNIL